MYDYYSSFNVSSQNLMGNSGFDLMSNLPMIIFGGLIIFLIAYIVIKKKYIIDEELYETILSDLKEREN